ncbi:hypothetical protein H4S04_000043 [Coemansia sp. S16]|nr:hypothetical protein H4S04_000043 [Coemansia sp. S16]
MRNSENGSAISRPGDRLAPFVMAYKAVRIRFQPTALSRLLDYPTETNPRTVWSYAQMSGMPLKAYKPSLGRKAIESAQIVPLNTAKWTIEEDQGETAVQATARTAKARWAKIPKIPLEQKHLSLLWLMAHAAVPTASKLSHYIPDLPPECKFCYTLSESNAADNSAVSDSQHAPRETIVHYFWLCPRIQEFWQRVSCFIQGIRDAPSGPVFRVDLRAVVTGFGAWSRRIPNADVLHGLAVWEIFRARAELSLDGKRLDGLAMFLRWKSAVISRILHDFYYSYSMIKAPHIFKKRWLTVSNRWYHFDPGDDELDGKISFRNESQQVAGRLHHIIQYHQQSAPDDDTNAPAAPDNLPIVA